MEQNIMQQKMKLNHQQSNLKIQELEINSLLKKQRYNRLYNIVKNDLIKSQYNFRKNLIKEIYFLLKITPYIEECLQDTYLEHIEKLYNQNDHKKVKLASTKMSKIVQNISIKQNIIEIQKRPKTGILWDQNINPVLRPYTAKKKQKMAAQQSNYKQTVGSTVADTQFLQLQKYNPSIEEQLEISKDFINKYRTIHKQYQPIYQQLFNILQKANFKIINQQSKLKSKKISYKINKSTKQILNENNQDQEQNNQQNNKSQQIEITEQNENIQQKQVQNNQQSISKQTIYINQNKFKLFQQDQLFGNRIQNKIQIFQRKNNQKIVINQLVKNAIEDQQVARKYVNLARTKSAFKRETNRKSESKRLVSAAPKNKSNFNNDNLSSQHKITFTKKQEIPNNLNEDNAQFPNDLTIYGHKNTTQQSQLTKYPKYNKRKVLDALYNRQIKKYKIENKLRINKYKQQNKLQNNNFVPFNHLITLHSKSNRIESFDPIDKQNIIEHNKQILSQINSIQRKVKQNHISIQSLMKTLYIDAYDAQYNWENKQIGYGMYSQGIQKKNKKMKKRRK